MGFNHFWMFVTFRYRGLNNLELYCFLTIDAWLKSNINSDCRYCLSTLTRHIWTFNYLSSNLPIFALKRCGFESRSVSFFLLVFYLPVVILVFVYTWIYLFESGIRLFNKYTRRNVNDFNKPKCNNTLYDFNTFVVICWLFFKINFFKVSFMNTIRVSSGLYPDQDQRFVGTDLGTNCLQR